MAMSRSFSKQLRRYVVWGIVVVLTGAVGGVYLWGYKATSVETATEAVKDFGYTDITLVSKRLTAFSDDCTGANALVAFVFDGVDAYTKVAGQVVVCANPDTIKKIYLK
jgi:hypothetical protein